MYVAHAKLKKQETSQQTLQKCLALLHEGSSDNHRFSAILTITSHVRSTSFTAGDRQTVLQAVGLEFLKGLVKSKSLPAFCPLDLYKSAVLSILSVWTVDPYIAQHPAMRDFLVVVNDVVSPDSPFKGDLSQESCLSYEQMCRDCEEIVSHLTKHELGLEHLLQVATFDLMFQYSTSPSCQNVALVLASLGSIVKTRGESCLHLNPDTFYAAMNTAVDRMQQGQDMKVKAEFARILTSFLTGVSMMEITLTMDWVVKLVQVLHKLVAVKMAPDDSEAILGLIGALVSTAGARILSSEMAGNYNFLKAVVALVYVEVYMQLDHITLENASDRSRQLDRVYKLLISIVQFVAESGETMDSDTVIVVYRKLVQTSDTIMDFVYRVANQEMEFQRNHIVVLLSVRTLAAMLSEITEDVTPRLLELLPFFNFLCRNVEYSDDVVMEVKTLAQAALGNIKSMATVGERASASAPELGLATSSSEHSTTHDKSEKSSCCESSNISWGNDERISKTSGTEQTVTEQFCDAVGDINSLNIETLALSDSSPCGTGAGSESFNGSEIGVSSKLMTSDGSNLKTESSSSTRSAESHPPNRRAENHSHNQSNNSETKEGETPILPNSETKEGETPILPPDICLSQESIDSFRAFQTAGDKPHPCSVGKVSFSDKTKTRHNRNDQTGTEQVEQWRPMPNDVLGYLLPAYMCLLDSEEALEVMVQSDTFKTIVNFLETSLSCLLEDQSSGTPENTTINALSVIEQVYLNSPASAATLKCLEELFEVSILSLPNLLCLPHPPPLVCLKLLEVTLSAYRLQGREKKRKSSLPWLKHSQSRLFKAAIEYLASFYEFRQRKGRPLSLHFQDNWPLAEDFWSGCISGLCTLVRSVDEIQDALARSSMLPDFLSFLASVDGLDSCSEDVQRAVESLCSLVEAAAESSGALLRLVLDNQGQMVASKFGLHTLTRLCRSSQA